MTESPRTALGPGHDHHNGPLSNSDGAAQLDGACCAGTMRRWAARAPTHPSTLVATARATGYLSTSRSPWAAALVQRFGAFECFEVRLRFVWKFGISQRFARSQISRDSNYVRLITDLLSSCLFHRIGTWTINDHKVQGQGFASQPVRGQQPTSFWVTAFNWVTGFNWVTAVRVQNI